MKILAFVVLLLTNCSSKSDSQSKEYFEGKIIYKNSAQSKNTSFTSEDLLRLSGDSSIFYFKNGNFRQDYDAKNLKQEFYIQKDNRGYIRENNSDTLFWYDRSNPGTEILKHELNKNRSEILGIKCDELILYYQNKTITYYFNSDSLKINPKWYELFTDLNKNFTSKKMGVLFLKCQLEYPDAIFQLTATSIVHEKLDNTFFQIPSNAVLIKVP